MYTRLFDSNPILSYCLALPPRNIHRGLHIQPDSDSFDIDVSRIFTPKQTREVKENPDIYKWLPKTSRFDFFWYW